MSNIKIKSNLLILPMFNEALAYFRSKEYPVPVLKMVRRICKKIDEEMGELREDSRILIRDIFGKDFSEREVYKLAFVNAEKRDKQFKELAFPPEKQEDFLKRCAIFETKAEELTKDTIEIPFPKVVLPDTVTFREDFALILQDVIDLD